MGVVRASETSTIEQADRVNLQVPSDAPTVPVPKIETDPITIRMPAFRTVIYQPAARSGWAAGQAFDAQNPQYAPGGRYLVSEITARPKRKSAPLALRLAVVGLFVVFLATLSGFIIVHIRPNLLRPLRNEITPRAAVVVSHQYRFSSLGGFHYLVPGSSYTVSFNISHPCWVIVHQLATGTTLFTATLQPTNTEQSVTITGSASLEIAARANAITVRHGLQTLGIIRNPVVGATYTFTTRS